VSLSPHPQPDKAEGWAGVRGLGRGFQVGDKGERCSFFGALWQLRCSWPLVLWFPPLFALSLF
jgi:hypothetical protein